MKSKKRNIYMFAERSGQVGIPVDNAHGSTIHDTQARVVCFAHLDKVGGEVTSEPKTKVYLQHMGQWVQASKEQLSFELAKSHDLSRLIKLTLKELDEKIVRRNIKLNPPKDDWASDPVMVK